jgi:hypothetical protein
MQRDVVCTLSTLRIDPDILRGIHNGVDISTFIRRVL